jgi:prepilin peptidase CpaA
MWNTSAQYPAELVPWGVAIAAAIGATVTDLRWRRIPNTLTGPLLIAGFAWSTWMSGFAGLGQSLLGALLVGLPFVVLWLANGSGAGDAKMMLALGAWLGPGNGIYALAAVALAGGVVSLAAAIANRRLLATLGGTAGLAVRLPFVFLGPGRLEDRQSAVLTPASRIWVPYAVSILLGVCAAAAWVLLVQA